MQNIRIAQAVLAAALTTSFALAQAPQTKNGPRPYPHPPDVANAHYGPHERNVLDVWKAKTARPAPVVVFIHGGGFTAGDKSGISQPMLSQCLEAGIAVATINYRYSSIAPYPAPMEDGARAVQFIRLHANEWNINPKAVACTGGSAGAGISLWIGFRDDMAQPSSDDPVRGVACSSAAPRFFPGLPRFPAWPGSPSAPATARAATSTSLLPARSRATESLPSSSDTI